MLEDPCAADNAPLDFVHLSRQCLGDPELEGELLGMFRLQAEAVVAELSGSAQLSLESKARISHKICGSALAVGARRVAGAARRMEELASSSGADVSAESHATGELVSSLAEVLAEIARIRD
jgi:HPt (histidine-containing phosphotransfer) domain-containing protein